MKVRTREYSLEKRKKRKIEGFQIISNNKYLKNNLFLFSLFIFMIASFTHLFIISLWNSIPFLYALERVFWISLLIFSLIWIWILLWIPLKFIYQDFIPKQAPYHIKKWRLHTSLKEVIKNTNLTHHWNFRREVAIEKKFKRYLFFDLIGIKIIIFIILFIWFSLIFPPKIFIIPYIFTLPLYFKKIISFHFQREKYRVIILRKNPQSYYWDKKNLYLY